MAFPGPGRKVESKGKEKEQGEMGGEKKQRAAYRISSEICVCFRQSIVVHSWLELNTFLST